MRRLNQESWTRTSRILALAAIAVLLASPHATAQRGSADTTLEEIAGELANRETDLSRCITRLTELDAEILTAENEFSSLKPAVASHRSRLQERIARLHRLEKGVPLRILFEARSGRELWGRLELVRLILKREIRKVGEEKRELESLVRKHQDLVSEQDKLQGFKTKLEERVATLKSAIQESPYRN